jgi:hypothetical protein
MAIATKPKKRAPSHAKKRQAKHHNKSKHYLKAYWPYIPMLIIVGAGLLFNSLWAQGNVLGIKTNYSPEALLAKTNEARSAQQKSSLMLNTQLAAAAQAKANDMVAHNYWAHNSPQGKTPWSFITASGYQYQAAGENLAYGFADANDTIIGWMNSTEHRANILNDAYTNVGFGVAQAPDYQGNGPQTIIVAEYGTPVPAVANITFTVPEPAHVAGVHRTAELAARPVSRIQLITNGKAAWSALLLSSIAGAALMLFVVRHGLRLKRAVLKGEHYIAAHPLLDIAVVIIITVGFVLTQSSGIIR